MIAVDSSALVAIVLGEEDGESMLALMQENYVLLSAAAQVEASIVVEAKQGPDAGRDLQLLIDGAVDRIVPVDAEHARVAVDAWRRFGKGRHPASLNFGDCFSYAIASIHAVPLLFKGEDFARTDVGTA